MDLVHDRAGMIAEEEEDRISNLPKEIIHHILSFLDMKYAIQTSKLSRKWKHLWTSMPHLNLNSQTFRTLPQFANFVKHVLSQRNKETEVSAAELTLRGAATQFVVKSIVNYAYSHNVRQMTMIWINTKGVEFDFPQYLFSSHTLKHLTLATKQPAYHDFGERLPNSTWDFPALETLNLSYIQLGDGRDKSLNLFSKCVNLKDLTLHGCSMHGLDIFSVCAPQLSNLTITDSVTFPKVFNVDAPQLKNLITSVSDGYTGVLQLSTKGFDSLETVNLSLRYAYRMKSCVPQLLDLFQKLHSAKFLILDVDIIKTISSCMEQLSYKPCPFDKLKRLKIQKVQLMQMDHIATMVTQVRNYLLENSPSATFIVDLPQVPHNYLRQHYLLMATRKRRLEAEIHSEEQVFAQHKAKLEAQHKAKLEALKLQHELSMSQIIKYKMAELHVQVVGGNPDYELIRSIGHAIKSIIDLTPKSLRVAMEAQFYCQYEEVKCLFLTHIDASQWAKIEIALGCTRHPERTHSDNIYSQSDVPAIALPPAP